MRLPVTVAFHPDAETPLSLASRLARAMAYPSMSSLLGDDMAKAVARGDADAINMLSSWSGIAANELRRFAVPTSEEAGEWRLGDAVFRKEMRVAGRFRFCPRCLAEDIERGEGRPHTRPYERASWLTRAVTSCTVHRELLIEADEGSPMSDVALFVSRGLHLKFDPGAPLVEAEIEVDAYIESRIAGIRNQSFIDRQEVHVVLMLFHFVGWLVHNRLPAFRIGGLLASSISTRAVGFRIVKGGREDVEAVVNAAIELHRPAARTITEFFGPIVRHLRRNTQAPAYAEIIELFQNIVERNVPVGPGDRFIQPVMRRQLHSVRSAAVEYGIDQKRVRAILQTRSMIQRAELADRQVYIRVSDAEEMLSNLPENLTTVEVGEKLGLHEDRVRELVQRHLLEVSEHGTKDGRPFYRISPQAVDAFVHRLAACVKTTGDHHDLVPLNSACMRKSLTQVDVIDMIIKGEICRVARPDHSPQIGGILIDVRELDDVMATRSGLANGTEGYLNLGEVERALSTTTVTVTALVKHGVLATEVRTNPRTRRRQPYVQLKTINAFLDSHRSLHRIASGWRRNIAWMKEELDQHGLEPIFKTSGKIARYYRIEDLAKAGLLPPNP